MKMKRFIQNKYKKQKTNIMSSNKNMIIFMKMLIKIMKTFIIGKINNKKSKNKKMKKKSN